MGERNTDHQNHNNRVDLPLNTIIGTSIGRDANGNFLVAADGTYVIDQTAKPIGDATPDFNLNLENSFQIRNFKISALVTYQHGGDIYSNTIGALIGRGVTTDTDTRLNTLILPGVLADGSPNNIQINNSTYYFSNIGFGAAELKIFDASHVRLQEVSIGYSLPKKFLDKSPFGSLSITFSGMNLWYLAYNTPKGINFDPNVAGTGVGNGRGFDFLNSASSRRYGFSIKATF